MVRLYLDIRNVAFTLYRISHSYMLILELYLSHSDEDHLPILVGVEVDECISDVSPRRLAYPSCYSIASRRAPNILMKHKTHW